MPNAIFDRDLDPVAANHVPLSPLSFLARTAAVYPEHPALIHGDRRLNWSEVAQRCRRLAGALAARGIGRGDTVAVLAPNVPALFEAHFGVPMAGAVLNAINTRLDPAAIGFILEHGEARVLMVDAELAPVARDALAHCSHGADILVVDIADAAVADAQPIGSLEYEALLAEGDPDFAWQLPGDEWDAISLNYTSGTTGDPKGVVYHHRGAYLNAVGNALAWEMGQHPVYLWTLPLFHCNGWCFPWTLAAVAGTSVCLRAVREEPIFAALADHGVTHFCGAPIVLNTLANAPAEVRRELPRTVKVMTAGAAPPASVLQKMEAMGFAVTHVYGLTETYGPCTLCAPQPDWDDMAPEDRARSKSRQGVPYHMLDGLMVADPETLEPVPRDGTAMGEVFMRGNNVMKGYLKNPASTGKAFAGGWFHSGDLAVWHPDGYIQIRDRSKDIIISGGENISSIEVEDVLYRHPAVLEAAVVAVSDEKWGETPCAVVTLAPGAAAGVEDIRSFCREHLAGFKVPRHVIFSPLPKTSTGKIQKFVLREQAEASIHGGQQA
ncbi:MAG: acyl-CoA synthetase [Gammaproteobacteria bacterium]|nr:acyl-CoA synthetase [Gammaproteobacteria bacterium]